MKMLDNIEIGEILSKMDRETTKRAVQAMSDDSFSSHFDVEVKCHDEQPADHSDLDWCSYKHCLVEHTGFDPVTSTMRL